MFAEGWVVYPRTSGSPEPAWHEARSAECQVGSGDPRAVKIWHRGGYFYSLSLVIKQAMLLN